MVYPPPIPPLPLLLHDVICIIHLVYLVLVVSVIPLPPFPPLSSSSSFLSSYAFASTSSGYALSSSSFSSSSLSLIILSRSVSPPCCSSLLKRSAESSSGSLMLDLRSQSLLGRRHDSDRGLVHKHCGNTLSVFVSHQWCGARHADPWFRQLRVLQGVFRSASQSLLGADGAQPGGFHSHGAACAQRGLCFMRTLLSSSSSAFAQPSRACLARGSGPSAALGPRLG